MKYITTIRLVLCCQGRHRGFLAVEALSIEEFWPSKLSCRCGFSSKAAVYKMPTWWNEVGQCIKDVYYARKPVQQGMN
uniref:Uncharacterized protein n=1 Tax=Cucumis melo TaxID=3656 RepID=A0A9I9ED17_CUCME